MIAPSHLGKRKEGVVGWCVWLELLTDEFVVELCLLELLSVWN